MLQRVLPVRILTRLMTMAVCVLLSSSIARSQETLPAGAAQSGEKPGVISPPSESILPLPVPELPGTAASNETGAPGDSGVEAKSSYDAIWSKVPRVPNPKPAPGYAILWPDGPGYYNALEQCEGHWREKPSPYPYTRFGLNSYPFFDFSFAYLDKPDNAEHDWLDPLKRIHVGDDVLLSTGGEFRFRYLNETNFQANPAGKDNTWDLTRARLFGDLWYRDWLRVYMEYEDAQSFNHDLAPGSFDRNFGDLLNAFVDVKVAGNNDRYAYLRVGRQELLYGSQRLVSPSEWANVRRNFDGFKFLSRSENLDFDAFLTRPVLPNAGRFDSDDDAVTFAGAWATFRPEKGQSTELYYLLLSNGNHVAKGSDGLLGGFDVHTIGTRYNGSKNNFLWDFEGMGQLGSWANQSTLAGAYTTALGYEFKDLPAIPQFWLEYDYASGGSGAGDDHHTFNQLFAFGHYYFGYVDVVGRQNINDISGQFVFFPTNWITTQVQCHAFYLNNARDALYNAAAVPIRRDTSGRAGVDVGQEIDLLMNFHLTNHQFVLLGYSHFFAGSFMSNTGNGKDIDFTYVQYNFRF
jgi:hypothetical protein